MQLQFLARSQFFFEAVERLQVWTWAEFFDLKFFLLCEIHPKAADTQIALSWHSEVVTRKNNTRASVPWQTVSAFHLVELNFVCQTNACGELTR